MAITIYIYTVSLFIQTYADIKTAGPSCITAYDFVIHHWFYISGESSNWSCVSSPLSMRLSEPISQ